MRGEAETTRGKGGGLELGLGEGVLECMCEPGLGEVLGLSVEVG